MSDKPPHEAMECLAALAEAAKHAERAAKNLRAAPDADLVTKSAIEGQLDQLRNQLDEITSRLDAMPTWRPPTTHRVATQD